MDYEQILEAVTDEERFRSTIAAMNTLLIQKGIYSPAEFEAYCAESCKAKLKKRGINID